MATESLSHVSIVIPAKNEARNIGALTRRIIELHPDVELLVVDDGSTDDTVAVAEAAGAVVLKHAYSKGNGAAIKTGARAATRNLLVFMDGDGQHRAEDIPRLLKEIANGYDMAVGARSDNTQASVGRLLANKFYNNFASWVVGHRIKDLTSGMRAVDAAKFREFIYMLPNGFSYPTTITMAFFRSGYAVGYVPIAVGKRQGASHLNPIRDGLKFLLIIFRVCTLYSPLKLFFPLAVIQFFTGLTYYGYTYYMYERFTNMSALLLTSALTTFLIGLVSEQITALLFKHDEQSVK